MWVGTSLNGGKSGGSSITVEQMAIRSEPGTVAWVNSPAVPATPVVDAPAAPTQKPAEAKPAPSGGRQEIVLKPGENIISQLPEQFRLNATTHNQRQFVLFSFPGAPVGVGDSKEQVSEFLSGPWVQKEWIENGEVFISFSFRGKTFTGKFLVNPYSNQVITKNPYSTLEYGKKPEDIPQSAIVAICIEKGEWNKIETDPNVIIGIIGLAY